MSYDIERLRDIERRLVELSGPNFAVEVSMAEAILSEFYPVDTKLAPNYTASLDAAISLVERALPDHEWVIGKGRMVPTEPLYGAQILATGSSMRTDGDASDGEGEHPTSIAIAVCLALVRALITKETAR